LLYEEREMDVDKYWAKSDGTTIEQHVEQLLEALKTINNLNYIEKELVCPTEEACKFHDNGKMSLEFQKRVRRPGAKFNPDEEVIHNVLSLFFINPQNFECEKDYYRVAHAVINHHDYGNVYRILEEKKELIAGLLEGFNTYAFKRKQKKYLENIIEDRKAILIKGYLHKCDYSASGDYTVEYPNDFLEKSLNNLLEKWKQTNPQSQWNELQKFCIDNSGKNIIAVAQTGMGKTEAGLLWIGDNKGYFVLPLRAAINAIYDRVCNKIVEGEDIEHRVAILHSEALEYYLNSHSDNEEMDVYEYHKRGKAWSMPLSITTMDQLFDFVFKYQGYELKLTTLAYSRVVIDEIQMYDPTLLAYLIAGLEKISELGGKIAIVTATLPPFIRAKLVRKIQFDKEEIFIDDLRRHNLKIMDSKINSEDIFEKYEMNKKAKRANKILVVCNTIKAAQKIYKELKELLPSEDSLNILHSRFTKKDRREKEHEILEFGKTYTNEEIKELDNQSAIWVSTSIVEASLDIDFDYLFTELQDLNSLFQRLGRCNRKGLKSISEANCFVYCRIDDKLLTENGGFIDSTMYKLSKEAVEDVTGLLSEREKIEMLEEHFSEEKLKNSEYMQRYRDVYNKIINIIPYQYKIEDIKIRDIHTKKIIPSTVYKENEEQIKEYETLIMETADAVTKIKLKERILEHTLDIPIYVWKNYEKAKNNHLAEGFEEVLISKREKISIMECEYEDLGFQEMNYEMARREPNIL